ncbi:MAG TPA: HlyD family type I secretion periplasmic adaptor subunit [Nitratidesulfovibrio sp.]|nr:HlyD family type I secretion periplasmic adaptor subunit [Nitratidesulfovibrio sp.]
MENDKTIPDGTTTGVTGGTMSTTGSATGGGAGAMPPGMPPGVPLGMAGGAGDPGKQTLAERLASASRSSALGSGSTQGVRRDDLEYMSEVDAALHRKGHPLAFVLSASLGGFFLIFIVWAAFASLDEVTRGQAQVIPSQRTQEIQNLEGGIISEIYVREGQIVEKGTVLVRLDNESAASFFRDAVAKSYEHMAAIARLEAEMAGKDPVYPAEVMQNAPQVVADQTSIHNARKRQLELELSVLESQLSQKRQEVDEMVGRQGQLGASLRVAQEQRDIARPLVEKQIYSKVDYLSLEQRVIQLRGDISSLAVNIPKARSAVHEVEQRLSHRKAEVRSQAVEEINKRRGELNSLRETLSAGEDRVTRTDLRAPVRGTVKRIIINTQGGVVKPGESILELVPLDDTLLVEARIRPADIAFLHPGQKAIVKITAYDFSIYGGLEAGLEQISADTIEDRKGEFYYLVKLRTKKSAITYRGESLPIMPGMTATVDILTGKKTVLDYLLKPILKAQQNALRER